MGDLEAKDVVRLLVKCKVAEVDEKAIRELLGERHATTLAELADGFDVSETTVRNTWRRGNNKIPGTTTRGGRGKFLWADCLLWYWRMRKTAAAGRGEDDVSKRKREAEARAAEADARIKERKAEIADGQFIPLSIAVNVVKGCANKLRDGLMNVARNMQPMFPAKYKSELTEEVNRAHRNLLTAFAESSISDLRAASQERSDFDV